MEEIKTGDAVILKSELQLDNAYRTAMTAGTIDRGLCFCYWFVNGELKKEHINVRSLMKA